MGAAQILDSMSALLRSGCPKVPPDVGHRLVAVSRPRGLAQIWFRTRGCRYRVQSGGCTVCDYGISDEPTPRRMIKSVAAAIAELPFEPRTLVLCASGSFLDPWEVPEEARTGVLELIARRLPKTLPILETHASTVTHEALTGVVKAIGPRPCGIEMGLECAEPALLSFCLNKQLALSSFQRAVSVIASLPNLKTTANVMVGLPFLSSTECVRSALMTLQWAFAHGVNYCVLFPVNVRPHTLGHWLCTQGLWSRPTLWDLVDVLVGAPPTLLDRIDLAWYAPAKQATPSPADFDAAPRTCPRCYDRVVALLGQYADSVRRHEICREMSKLDCSCRFRRECHRTPLRSLRERVSAGYEQAAIRLLGREVWQQKASGVAEELAVLDNLGSGFLAERRESARPLRPFTSIFPEGRAHESQTVCR